MTAAVRPVVYMTVRDPALRARLADVLHRQGWFVAERPTGFHIVQSIADVIDGRTWLRPGLIVADAFGVGCHGLTIAAGLRDLGVRVPIILIAHPGDPLPTTDEPGLLVVDPASAPSLVEEHARPLAPIHALALPLPQRASA